MADLTKDEMTALEKMRKTFSEADSNGLPLNDATFLRYLRARSFDATKSSAMLAATVKWRKDFGICDMHSKSWEDILAKENCTGKMYVRGLSREGHPILYMKPKLENTNDHDGNMKHLVYTMERAVATGDSVAKSEKVVLIIDYEGFTLSGGPPMKTAKETLSILQNHYPERLQCAYLIRTPWIFNAFWTVISPFIDPITKTKIKILKGDDIISQLSEKLDPSVLETTIGGDDARPFNSSKYLQGEFHRDFTAILNDP